MDVAALRRLHEKTVILCGALLIPCLQRVMKSLVEMPVLIEPHRRTAVEFGDLLGKLLLQNWRWLVGADYQPIGPDLSTWRLILGENLELRLSGQLIASGFNPLLQIG